MKTVPDALHELTPEAWHAVVKASVADRDQHGLTLPGFPPPEVQERFVGASFERALDEAFNFYSAITAAAARFGRPLTADSSVLDFGIGWGRIARYFLRDVAVEGIYGIDAMPLAIELCKQTGVPGSLIHCDELPPTVFASDRFDVIYAYSVFSHLAERAQLAWIEEFARILKPGGVLVVTSRSDYFLSYVETLVGTQEPTHLEASLLEMFSDIDAVRAQFAAGEFIFRTYPSGGGGGLDEGLYGEAFVPRAYAEREWTRYLKLRDFSDDPAYLPQSVLVLQKD